MSPAAPGALAARQAALRGALAAAGLEGLVVTRGCNVRYLTNHVGSAGVVLLTRDTLHLLVDSRYSEAVRRLQDSASACPELTLEVIEGSAGYDEAVVEHLAALGSAAVGFEAADLTVSRHDWWRKALADRGARAALRPTERLIERQRMVKDAGEVALLREAAARLTPVAEAAFAALRPGVTERRAAARIDAALGEAGFERPAFDTIVAGGPNSALPHHHPGDRALEPGDLVVLDFGGVLGGYCSDLTRMAVIGAPTAQGQALYDAVRDAQAAALGAIRPGVDASAVDRAARDVLEARGLGEAFGHGTGHGLGLEVHEEPRVGRPRLSGATPLEPGMVFTVEPGAYVPGVGGVRLEDDVLVTDSGCEVLTAVPRELRTIR